MAPTFPIAVTVVLTSWYWEGHPDNTFDYLARCRTGRVTGLRPSVPRLNISSRRTTYDTNRRDETSREAPTRRSAAPSLLFEALGHAATHMLSSYHRLFRASSCQTESRILSFLAKLEPIVLPGPLRHHRKGPPPPNEPRTISNNPTTASAIPTLLPLRSSPRPGSSSRGSGGGLSSF